METIGKMGAKLSALGIAAGVFAQIDDGAKDLAVFKEIVNLIFNAAGVEPVDWESPGEARTPIGEPAK